MKKSVISFKISRRSRKKSFVEALCDQLGDLVVYVPVLATENHDDRHISVQVVKLSKGAQQCVPVFASEKGLALWQKETGHAGEWLALFGSDLCAALSEQVFLSFYPGEGQGSAVLLAPEMVERIADSGGRPAQQTPSMKVLDIGSEPLPSAAVPSSDSPAAAPVVEEVIPLTGKESALPQ